MKIDNIYPDEKKIKTILIFFVNYKKCFFCFHKKYLYLTSSYNQCYWNGLPLLMLGYRRCLLPTISVAINLVKWFGICGIYFVFKKIIIIFWSVFCSSQSVIKHVHIKLLRNHNRTFFAYTYTDSPELIWPIRQNGSNVSQTCVGIYHFCLLRGFMQNQTRRSRRTCWIFKSNYIRLIAFLWIIWFYEL